MKRLKEIWAVLLVLVLIAAVPVMFSGCGDDNEQDKAEKLIDDVKKDVKEATD